MITIASPVERIESDNDLAAVLQAYFAEYADRFGGYALTREVGVSIDAIRLRAWVARAHRGSCPAAPSPSIAASSAARRRRDCWSQHGRPTGPTPSTTTRRSAPGHELEGPAVLEAADTTILVYDRLAAHGWTVRIPHVTQGEASR